jgi:hypothetical protein
MENEHTVYRWWEHPPVTLARVWEIEAGRGYVTVPFVHETDGRGQHMIQHIRRSAIRGFHGKRNRPLDPDAGMPALHLVHRTDDTGDPPPAE